MLVDELELGQPVERVWIVWHAMIGLGAGLLFIPAAGPPIEFIIAFLLTAGVVLLGTRSRKKAWVAMGLMGLAGVQIVRAVVLWQADVAVGSRLVASFLWSMLAVGAFMEAYAVKNRGIS